MTDTERIILEANNLDEGLDAMSELEEINEYKSKPIEEIVDSMLSAY